MADPVYLPGTFITQAGLAELLAQAPLPYTSWFPFLFDLHPSPLPEVPIWYVTVVTDALRAGRITDDQARSLLVANLSPESYAEPVSLLQAFASLTQAMAVNWPKRRQASSRAVLRMNAAVARRRKAALRG